MTRLADIARRLSPHGLVPRGAFAPTPADGVAALADGRPAGTLVMVGHLGDGFFPAFSAWRATNAPDAPDPLDRWTAAVLGAVAAATGGEARFPFTRPYAPFQRWAKRAEGLAASPLGLLIHPEAGLWHAYRGALVYAEGFADGHAERPDGPAERSASPSVPCAACAGRPCLHACPVGAFAPPGADGATRYDVGACRTHLATPEGGPCRYDGCRARDACPVGADHRYGEATRRFLMAAFAAG